MSQIHAITCNLNIALSCGRQQKLIIVNITMAQEFMRIYDGGDVSHVQRE